MAMLDANNHDEAKDQNSEDVKMTADVKKIERQYIFHQEEIFNTVIHRIDRWFIYQSNEFECNYKDDSPYYARLMLKDEKRVASLMQVLT